VLLGYVKKLVVEDVLPANQVFKGLPLFVQDFTAPFYLFLEAGYRMTVEHFVDDFYEASAELVTRIRRGSDDVMTLTFDVNNTGIACLRVVSKDVTFSALCIE
jgi:hypothetical protein